MDWASRTVEFLMPRGGFRAVYALPGFVVWVSCALYLGYGTPLRDNDSWMHAVRLLEILERGGWAGGATLRDGAPFGYGLHWTMPLDAIALALAAPFAAFRGWEQAVLLVAPYVAPLTGLLLILALVWAVAPLGRPDLALLAGIFVAIAPPLVHYGAVGVFDHHLLIEAAMVAALGAAWRVTAPGDHRGIGVVAGLFGAFALWAGLESMPAAMAGAGWIAALAVLAPDRYRRSAVAYALALTVFTALALAIDRPLEAATTDRLGPVLLAQSVLAGMVVLCAVARPVAARPLPSRMAIVGGAGLAAAALWLAVWLAAKHSTPGFTDPAVERLFWRNINEFGPADNVFDFFFLLGVPLLAIGLAALEAWRREGASRRLWIGLAVAQLALLAAGCLWLRMSVHAAVLASVILAAGVAELMEMRLGLWGRVARTVFPVALLALPAGVAALAEPPAGRGASCYTDEAARLLDTPDGPIVLADANLSAPLLYHSRHLRTVSGPYHVNPDGLIDIVRFGTAEREEDARAIVDRRGVRYVLLCAAGGMPDGGMRRRLFAGVLPPWLVPVRLAETASEGLRLFRVAPSAATAGAP